MNMKETFSQRPLTPNFHNILKNYSDCLGYKLEKSSIGGVVYLFSAFAPSSYVLIVFLVNL